MWQRRRNRVRRALALGLALGAVSAPAAQAYPAYEPGEGAGSPAGGQVVPAAPGGFDWNDAGIGAAAAAAGLALLAGAGVTARRRGHLAGVQ